MTGSACQVAHELVDAVEDVVVADQLHAVNAVHATLRWFVDVPYLDGDPAD